MGTEGDGSSGSLTTGSIPRAVVGIALPTWGAFLTHDMMGVVDMFFVGKLGAEAVASVAMSGVMFGIIIMLGQGIAAGTTALVANALGRGDRARAEEVLTQSLIMAGGLSVLVAALGISCARGLLGILGASTEVVAIGAGYLSVVAGGSFTMMLMMVFGAALRAAGDARTPFKAMVIGNVINAILDPIFIFGWLGVPALGVAGSAWATVASRGVALMLMVRVFFGGDHEHFHLHLRALRPRLGPMREIAGMGIFASGRMLLRTVGGLLLMRIVAMFGTVSVAAYGIGMRLQMFVFGPSMGFGTAAAALVGQNLGAGKPARAARAAWLSMAMACGIALCLSVVYCFEGRFLTGIFNDDPEVIEAGANLLRWFGVSFVFLSATFVLCQAMTGAGDTLAPMVIVGVSLVLVGVPLAYGLARLWGSAEGVWASVAFTNIVSGVLSAWAFRRGRWRAVGERIGLAAGQGAGY